MVAVWVRALFLAPVISDAFLLQVPITRPPSTCPPLLSYPPSLASASLAPTAHGRSPGICWATSDKEEAASSSGASYPPPPPPPPPSGKRPPLRKALSPSAINSLLVKCSNDLECLLGMIDIHLASFNAVNCATALDRLSRMAVQERKEKVVREDPIFSPLLDRTGSTCHALSTPALVSLLKNLARLRASDTSLVQGLETALEQRYEALSPPELVGVITGLAAMREPPSPLLLSQLEARLESLSGSDLASAVEAVARMRSRTPAWAKASLQTASEKSALEAGAQDPTDLSRTIKGLTQMRHRPSFVVLKAFEDGMRADQERLQAMDPSETSSTLVSLATLRHPLSEEALGSLEGQALAALDDLSLLDIANLLQALSYYRNDSLASSVLRDCYHAMEDKLIGATPEVLKASVTALAQIQQEVKPSHRFWQRFTSVMSSQLDSFSSSQLIRTMSGLVSTLGTEPAQEALWEGLVKASQKVLPDADHWEVAALASLMVDLLESGALKQSPSGFMTAYNARLRRVVARLTPSALVTVTQLLVRCSPTLPGGLLTFITNRMRDLLPDFLDLPGELARVILNLTGLGRAHPEQAALRCLVEGFIAHAAHLPASSLLAVMEALALHQMQPGPEVWAVLNGRLEKEDLLAQLTLTQQVSLLWCLVVLDDPSLWPYSLPQELLSSISQGLEVAGAAEELVRGGDERSIVMIQQLVLASRYRLVPVSLGPWITRLTSLVPPSQPQLLPPPSSRPHQQIRREIKSTFDSLELPCSVEMDARYPGWSLTVRVGKKWEESVALVVHGNEPVGLTDLTARLLKRRQDKAMDRPLAVVTLSVAQWRAAVNKGVAQYFLLQKLSSEDIKLPSWCERLVVEPSARIVRQQQYGGALAPDPKTKKSPIEISWML